MTTGTGPLRRQTKTSPRKFSEHGKRAKQRTNQEREALQKEMFRVSYLSQNYLISAVVTIFLSMFAFLVNWDTIGQTMFVSSLALMGWRYVLKFKIEKIRRNLL